VTDIDQTNPLRRFAILPDRSLSYTHTRTHDGDTFGFLLMSVLCFPCLALLCLFVRFPLSWRSMEGSFRVRLSCSDPAVSFDPLRGEGAGMHTRVLPGRWLAGSTAAGSANHGSFLSNPKYHLTVLTRGDVWHMTWH
jgi:hypothetical protein